MKYVLQDITAADAEALRDFADFLDGAGEGAEKPKRPRSSGGGRKGKADTAANELGNAAGPMETTNVAPPAQTMPFPAPPVAGVPAPPIEMPFPAQQPVAPPTPAPAAPVTPTWDDIRQAGAKVVQHPQFGQAYITEMMTRYGIAQGQAIETLNPAYIPQFYGELAAIANQIP